MGAKYRYPGSKPFEASEKNLFFGREDDIERLSESIQVEQLLVLYGKSGLGKSSLLNAGVLPKLHGSIRQSSARCRRRIYTTPQ